MNDYKLVPVEPTLDMLCEGMDVYGSEDCAEADVLGIYKAMLAAAPAVQGEPDVASLVEALDMTELRKLLLILRGNIGGAMWTLDDEEEELAVRTEKAIAAIDAIAALAAHRKGGE